MRDSVNCRILTDIDAGFIREDTFKEFKKYNVEMKSLRSLHAKIYIVDDWCLVTSANLTGTAFRCRHEIGISTSDSKEIIATFERWWKKAKAVSNLPQKKNTGLINYQDGTTFPPLFNLPQYNHAQDKYNLKCEYYKQFAAQYEQTTGRNERMVRNGFSLLQEIDYLFNYLYNDHPSRPSNNCSTPRSVSDDKRQKEIIKYFELMSKHYEESQQIYRVQDSEEIQSRLSPNKIDRLTWDDVREVLKRLHCLKSRSYYVDKFINSGHNNLRTVRATWKALLHTGPITMHKIKKATNALYAFGESSAQEIIGWYYPNDYPLINSNSDCGMRFFGYNV